jgi:hypothetical protein
MAGIAALSRYKAPVVALVLLGSVSGFMAGQQLGHPRKTSAPHATLQPEKIVNVQRGATPATRQLSHVILTTPADAPVNAPAQWHTSKGNGHHDHHGHGHHGGGDG